MPASKAKNLSSLFLAAVKTNTTSTAVAAAAVGGDGLYRASTITSPADEASRKPVVSLRDAPSSSTTASTSNQLSIQSSKLISLRKKSSLRAASDLETRRLKLETVTISENPTTRLTKEISSILCGTGSSFDSKSSNDEKFVEAALDIPWFSNTSNSNISLRRKEISRERKQKWTFKNTRTFHFRKLVRMCASKIGTDATIQVFGRLGRETGVKEYNALIGLCIEKAQSTDDEEVSAQQTYKAFQLFKSMREQGFQLQDQTYGPFLKFLIDMGMVEEFYLFSGVIKDENPRSISRLGYYEMLLWIKANNEKKIEELCSCIASNGGGANKSDILESYLLALCESDRKEEMLQLLKIVDITEVSSMDYVSSIFKSLGRQELESFAEKFILALKTSDYDAENITNLIFDYAVSLPNLAVEDVCLKFKNFQAKMKVALSSISYEMLVKYCCDSRKVHVALDVVDQMSEAGIKLSVERLNFLLQACECSVEFNLVHRIYALIRQHDLKPNNETFRSMINLCVRMKDFVGAYGMLYDLQKMNLVPTASMFNAIMVGYFREKNFHRAMIVLKQMEDFDVKPDAQTFCYLIGNCNREQDITKYFDELEDSGVQVTKSIYMALINAYASCGQFEKAKQVVLGKRVPVKGLNEIKSVLVSVLATHGQISDALDIYEGIKHAGCYLDQRAILSLIEYLQSEGELNRLLQLLGEFKDPDYWFDGCFRVILYCVRYKHLSALIDLFKQLKKKLCNDEVAIEGLFDEAFSHIGEAESTHLQLGLDLLQAIKEELGLHPSRKCLDFLLTACTNAKDLHNSHLIWKEYQIAGLPYNILSFLRMYQALVASGDHKSAREMLDKIPKDDPHVRSFIKACETTYIQSNSLEGTKKRKTKEKKKTEMKN